MQQTTGQETGQAGINNDGSGVEPSVVYWIDGGGDMGEYSMLAVHPNAVMMHHYASIEQNLPTIKERGIQKLVDLNRGEYAGNRPDPPTLISESKRNGEQMDRRTDRQTGFEVW